MHDIIETHADFLIEAVRPFLEQTSVDYIFLNEDLSMKNGPLLSPKTYRKFIFPRLKRVVEFYKSHSVRYVMIDTDGNPEVLIPYFLDAGIDGIWPMERTADQDPIRLRKKFGRSLRLWGGVDKRVLATTCEEIDAHLRFFIPLIEEGGFIPTVDHTVPPDVPFQNFIYYMQRKQDLLAGRL
jgi:uroporphyrinogen decarboxylase